MNLDWISPELRAYLEAMTEPQRVALVLAGEARSEPIEGVCGVANVIRNRVNAKTWFGQSYSDVVTKKLQFSCLFEGGGKANYRRVLQIAKQFAEKQEITDVRIRQCILAAHGVMDNWLQDNTRSSTHYCVYTLTPAWAKDHKPAARLGAHHFFNDIK